MSKINEITLSIFADYFQFYIQDETVEVALDPIWTNEAVEVLLITSSGVIGVGTARNMHVPVAVKIFSEEPEVLSDNTIDQINECDLDITSGRIVISGCTDYFPDAQKLDLEKGIYRTRIYYANLNKIGEDGLEGDDFYEIHLWKTDQMQGLKVIKHKS